LLDQGTVLVDTTATGNVGLTWSPYAIMTSVFTPTGQRHSNGNWVLKPINGGDRLGAMRLVYQIATGQRNRFDPNDCACRAYFAMHYEVDCTSTCAIPEPGWYACGSKHDLPRDACFVGRCGSTFIWVLPGGEQALSRLTFTILDIAWKDRPKPMTTVNMQLLRDPKLLDDARMTELRESIRRIIQERDEAIDAATRAAEQPFNPIQSMIPAYGS
jgi:hypothetical protein